MHKNIWRDIVLFLILFLFVPFFFFFFVGNFCTLFHFCYSLFPFYGNALLHDYNVITFRRICWFNFHNVFLSVGHVRFIDRLALWNIYQGIQSVQFNFYGCTKRLFRRSYIDINLNETIAPIPPSFTNTLSYDK